MKRALVMTKPEKRKQDSSKFIMTGLSIVISGDLLLIFINSIINNHYLINFTIDSIVGVFMLVFLVRNLYLKHQMIRTYTKSTVFILLDGISLLLSLIIKLAWKSPLDITLLILFISYLFSRRLFDKELNK